jgi:hypothetical protein
VTIITLSMLSALLLSSYFVRVTLVNIHGQPLFHGFALNHWLLIKR